MAEAADDEQVPPSSKIHACITIGTAHAHYTEVVLAEWEAAFRQL
mgnify:CR=1 FL=1